MADVFGDQLIERYAAGRRPAQPRLPAVVAVAAAVVEAGIDSRGQGLIINSSRSVLYAGSDSRFAESAAAEAAGLRERINRHRRKHDRGAA